MLYETPTCGPEEEAALAKIDGVWRDLRFYVAKTNRWVGSVRRVLAAKANQSSNSIEGYNISTEDAIAAIQGAVEPTDSGWEDWQANLGYRRAMTYVLQLSDDQDFEYSTALMRSLHFMMTEYSLQAHPGRWRPGPIWVQDSLTGDVVYEAPDRQLSPGFVEELMVDLTSESKFPTLVRAAMAHLNLVLIHPFSDGNGRMSRCLQSLVLVRGGFLAREFCSIEEYLGQPQNQQKYYAALADVAKGQWSPQNSARSWVRYCLEAHYIQALSVLRRVRETERVWNDLSAVIDDLQLPPRTIDALYDASLGLRVRNASYRANIADAFEEISSQTATNDLHQLVRVDLLSQNGTKRGAHYIASEQLRQRVTKVRGRRTPISAAHLFDPTPELPLVYPSAQSPQPSLFETAAQG
ncbi:MAG: Fic family protein [Acidimicrobiales bacterium]